MKPVILAGGTGSRLWPKSRAALPKQFLALTSKNTMIQETVMRLAGVDALPPSIICNEEHRFLVAEQMRQINIDNSDILLEPVGRNTAPAIALAALHATANGEDPTLLVLAADHLIQDSATFQQQIKQAQILAEQGKLVTFGIVPTQPHTGYGYIKAGAAMGNGFEVSQFVEKP
ncbi:MAG: sugar phosphate nucleotidyltransferase, partial [Pseudomonadota bacterium]|nr:sugar phosphate nucleotidyltransferase [Pseudomonadota bacterium]